ncbi:MAG: hypothetical protein ACOX3T_06390 [Bdellovibrionota bacterium]
MSKYDNDDKFDQSSRGASAAKRERDRQTVRRRLENLFKDKLKRLLISILAYAKEAADRCFDLKKGQESISQQLANLQNDFRKLQETNEELLAALTGKETPCSLGNSSSYLDPRHTSNAIAPTAYCGSKH